MFPPKRALPDGYIGNVPEPISEQEKGHFRVIYDKFEAPPILSNYELETQLGPEGSSINPLWFLINPFKLPCAKRALLFGTTVGSVIAISTRMRTKAYHLVLTNFSLGFGAGSIMSLLHCRKIYQEQLKYNPLSAASRMEYAKSPEEYIENARKSGASEEQLEHIKKIVGRS